MHSRILPDDQALELLKECLNSNCKYVGIDVETNGKDCRDGRGYGHGFSLAFRNGSGAISAAYFPLRHTNLGAAHNYNARAVLPLLQEIVDTKTAIYHNAKGDLVFLSTFGINAIRGRFICSLHVAHLVDENLPLGGKSLEACSKHYLNDSKLKDPLKKAIELFGWHMLTPDLICEYAMYDAVLHLKLGEALMPLARAEKLEETWAHKVEYTKCVIDMESMGIEIDVELCNRMAELGRKRMQEEVNSLGGLNPGSRNDQEELFINQLGLDPIMKKRKRKDGSSVETMTFDKDAMEIYDKILELRNDSTARHVLNYRGWQKSVTSNYEPYVELLSPDGRLRPNYKLHGTKTGRMSCENPNLQQIPKAGVKPWNGEMKKCFVPASGFALWGFDYSQLELRVGTAYAQEPSLGEVFQQGRDVFTEMSNQLGMTRNDTKTLVYSIQYGAGINRISNVFGVSRARAEEIRQNYYQTYPRFRDITKEASSLAIRDRKIRLWSGRYRHFLYPEDESFKAFNSVIQGGSADVVERAMLRIWKMGFPQDECRMLLQVHDELIFEIREDLVEKYKPIIMDAMTTIDYHPMFDRVKFAAEGKRWGEK